MHIENQIELSLKGDLMIKEIFKFLIKYFINSERRQKDVVRYINNVIYLMDIQSIILNSNFFRKRILNYKILSKKFRIYNKEIYLSNNFYGIANSLNNYSRYNFKIKACIEHGLYIGNHTDEFETRNDFIPSIITFSNYRKKIIQKVSNKLVFTIGPYIHYANELLSEEDYIDEKKKIGKNLLVIPTHSIENINFNYNLEQFVQKIKSVKDEYEFDTVNICLYWADICRGLDKIYIKNGFNIVTAGYRDDIKFLSRLKTLIKLSDLTMSNGVGTHVGYCVYLNRPHYIMNQHINIVTKNRKYYDKEFMNRDFESSEKIQQEIYEKFRKVQFNITNDQWELCNKYWGFDKIKSSVELKFIFGFIDVVFKKMNNNNIKNIVNKCMKDIHEVNNLKLISEAYEKLN